MTAAALTVYGATCARSSGHLVSDSGSVSLESMHWGEADKRKMRSKVAKEGRTAKAGSKAAQQAQRSIGVQLGSWLNS